MLNLLNSRLRITLQDSRTIIGQLLAFDKHMNMVLSECEEFRRIKSKPSQQSSSSSTPSSQSVEREEKRTLGLVILRGETIISMSIESGPPPDDAARSRLAALNAGGPGIARPGGRGLPVAPAGMGGPAMGLAGPVRGVGGPAQGMMQPGQMGRGGIQAAPVAYGRPGMPPGMPPMGGPPRPGMPGMLPVGGPPAGMPPFGRGMPPPGGPPMGGAPPMGGMPPAGFPRPGMPPMPPPGFRPPPGGMMPPPRPGFPGGPPPGFRPPQ
ncbi:hypothetical protein HK097_000381 [Rhizophlyctis rosea]|uniref:Sm protein B n=1 Tax=Rhizophlyctis rosea TaxID=64517 RepID=A0AAD5X7N1_9FUNG|nr:hypothetical protein HK097_000381 [Rhizophlyctis rosea]